MVSKSTSKEMDGGPPPLDENWWRALLADEEKAWSIVGKQTPYSAEAKKEHRVVDIDWEHARQIYAEDDLIELQVTSYNRGGLLVEGEALHGFVPISHLVDLTDIENEEDREQFLAAYVGRTMQLKVIECDAERGRVVFSERAGLTEAGSRNELLERLREGSRTWGTVTNITDFGVFVDLGGLEGLVHVSEISWGRVRHPSDSVALGEQLEVFVINVDEERSRVGLSLKRLTQNPWDYAAERYFAGQITEAVITSILPFGAFARLEEGLDGLIHATELGQPGVKPFDILYEGQRVQVRVLQVDAANQRLGLSLNLEGD
jgi:small subunit ribosomal protein S1